MKAELAENYIRRKKFEIELCVNPKYHLQTMGVFDGDKLIFSEEFANLNEFYCDFFDEILSDDKTETEATA